MYEFLVQNPVIAIIFMLIATVVVLYIAVKIMQMLGMAEIRGYVYTLFVKAEHKFKHGDNVQKFEYVVQLARSHLPRPFSLFITEPLLRTVVQAWFDLCKDALDDGELNGTSVTNDTEEE